MHSERLLLLGTGQVAKSVIRQSGASRRIIASTRDPRRVFELAEMGVEPLIMPVASAEIVEPLARGADIVVSFPPDGTTDAVLAPACAAARSIVYISSTGVYGAKTGKIDDSTEPDMTDERMLTRIEAEKIWRQQGAVVLRAPGIYGPESGLHLRLKAGTFKLPGDGSRFISRIHLDDLAGIILSVFDAEALSDRTYLVGDESPCSIGEVVSWLCKRMNLSLPQSVPIEELNHTLRGNRSIDSSRIRSELGYLLKYPGYKEGYEQCLACL